MDIINKLKHTNNVKLILKKLSLKEISNLIDLLNKEYYESKALISDEIYDKIIKYVDKTYPDNKITNKIGYEPDNKIKLPYYMGSEDKIYDKDENKLNTWIKKYGTETIIISAKADGISILWDIDNNKLYTRGNGVYGKDVSWFLKYMNIPLEILNNNIIIRGELIINKPLNRNNVSGAINSICDHKLLPEIRFVGYEVMYPRISQKDQFMFLEKYNIETVLYKILNINDLTFDILDHTYKVFNDNSSYYIDGLVIRNNNVNEPITSGNPPWSICYKTSSLYVKTRVVSLEWNISKYNVYIPIAIIEPVIIQDKQIKKVTCHNAKYVIDNGINTDAIIEIEYRGGTIPKIKRIISPVIVNKSDLPSDIWNGVNLIATDDTKEVNIKIIIDFFKILDVKGVNKKVINTLYDEGIDTILKILSVNLSDYIDDSKQINKNFIHAVHKIKSMSIDLPLAISALSIPYLTFKNLDIIYKTYPDFLKIDKYDYSHIKGIGKKTSENIKNYINKNIQYIRDYLMLLDISYSSL